MSSVIQNKGGIFLKNIQKLTKLVFLKNALLLLIWYMVQTEYLKVLLPPIKHHDLTQA